MSNYLISNAAGLLGATASAETDFKSTILVEPSAAVEVSQDLASASLPSAERATSVTTSLDVKHNNEVTKTINPDGSVTYESYGITTTIEPSSRTSILTEQEVPSENRSWTINNTTQCQALDAAFNNKFAEQYPGKRNPFSSIDVASLKEHIGKQKETVILFSDNGQVDGGLNYTQEKKLGEEFGLMHDPDFSPQARLMVYKQLVVERGFIGRDGNLLAFKDIGGKNDANGDGNYVTRGKANSSGWSPGLYVHYNGVGDRDSFVAPADDLLSAAFVLSVPESKS